MSGTAHIQPWAYFNLIGAISFNLELLEKIKNQLLLL